MARNSLQPPPEVIVEFLSKANYVNPETRGEGIVVMEIVLLVLCFIVVALRVWTRAFQSKSFGIDDVLIIFNLVEFSPVLRANVILTWPHSCLSLAWPYQSVSVCLKASI